MILIENKLEIFEDIVYKSRLLKLEGERDSILKERERLTEEKQRVLDKELKQAVDRRENLAQVLGNEQIAKAKEERRVLQLRKMNELEEDLVESIRQRARDFVKGPSYERALLEGIGVTLSHLKAGNYQIGLLPRDQDLYFEQIQKLAKEKKVTFTPFNLEDTAIGGHIVRDEKNTYNLNNDLNTMIDEKKYEIGKLLYKLFHEEVKDEH